jgi:hypothetical protein
MVPHNESSFSVPTELPLQRIDQPQKTTAVQAEAALKWIGKDARPLRPRRRPSQSR